MKDFHRIKEIGKARFSMAFHAFQPVFNLEGEIEKAFSLAYEPFLEVLERFPGVKATFHFSGNMLEWFEKNKPGYIEMIRNMLERGQIEIMGGGFFEPIMPHIPRQDATEQIRMMSGTVERIFGEKPAGAWTTERVWHRTLADIYSDEEMKYTILDDHHLLSSFVGDTGRYSPCVTCGDTGSVVVLPASTKLRYLMPFGPVSKTIDYMKSVARRNAGTEPCFFFADDLEKFGAWPHTHYHVYKKKWLEKFFKALLDESKWLETAKCSEMIVSGKMRDVGVLQPVSYFEMEEWAGGDFGNFMSRYPESGRMHGRMLEVSGRISENIGLGDGVISATGVREARTELFKAQTNCPYWHGTFGGVYLPHLRAGVYSHIIRAEKILDRPMRSGEDAVFCFERSLGKDRFESVMGNSYLKIYIDPLRGATISEVDLQNRELNLVNSFSRRKEVYHRMLKKGGSAVTKKARKAAMKNEYEDVDIHEILGVSEKGLEKVLAYDGHRRTGFITRIASGKVKWEDFAAAGKPAEGPFGGKYSFETASRKDLITQTFSRRGALEFDGSEQEDIKVTKRITLGYSPEIAVSQTIKNFSRNIKEITAGVEFNFLVWDTSAMKSFKTFTADTLELKDRYSGLEVKFFMDRPLRITRYPVYTVNETERGLGKTFQGVCVVIGDNFVLGGSEEEKIEITLYVR
jgi:4-alpha-glucanotransferase